MRPIYLFDWGNTLMIDFPQYTGKMCDWERVQAIDGALEALHYLSQQHQIYIATGAADSTAADIQRALSRVGLANYISGYFCQDNLGIGKVSAHFYQTIAVKLEVEPARLTMVGDRFEQDIQPARHAGLNAIWFNPQQDICIEAKGYPQISDLRDLIHL
jgi:FMN phosphatase YigB (HAD superfamily)